jgi:hypothetical protein
MIAPMPNPQTVVALALAFVALAAAPQAQPARPASPQGQPQGQPQYQESNGPIVADPPIADFGIVRPGTTVAKTVRIVNPLDRPVKIRLAKPSCTCTTVDMTGKTIPARGFLEMPMSMKTPQSVGKKTAQVNMVFEGLNQLLAVRLEAETAYAVRANPPYVDALAPERMKGFFEVLSTDGKPFTVTAVAGGPARTADGSPQKPAQRQVVTYDFTAGGSVPPFLIVETDHPECPVFDLRVRHETTRIAPALGFAEYRANLGAMAPKSSATFELEIKHAGADRVAMVESLDPRAKTELVGQRADGDSVVAIVKVDDLGLPAGTFLFPCRFTSTGGTGGQPKAADFWLYGTVRAGGG